jgi:hypothetical protein
VLGRVARGCAAEAAGCVHHNIACTRDACATRTAMRADGMLVGCLGVVGTLSRNGWQARRLPHKGSGMSCGAGVPPAVGLGGGRP